jgi:hypothetical protein
VWTHSQVWQAKAGNTCAPQLQSLARSSRWQGPVAGKVQSSHEHLQCDKTFLLRVHGASAHMNLLICFGGVHPCRLWGSPRGSGLLAGSWRAPGGPEKRKTVCQDVCGCECMLSITQIGKHVLGGELGQASRLARLQVHSAWPVVQAHSRWAQRRNLEQPVCAS